MRTRIYLLVSLAVLFAILLGGCAPAAPQPQPAQPAQPAQPTAAPAQVQPTSPPQATAAPQAAAATKAPSGPLKKVTIAVGTYVLDATYPYLMLPVELGWWKDMGYDVTVVPVGGSMDALQQTVGGKADFIQGDAAVMVQANVKENIPMRDVMQGDAVDYALVVPKESPIKDIKDIKGKRIGVFSLASGSIPLLKAYLAENGIGESDVNLIAIGYGPQASEALKRNNVDAIVLWTAALAELENLGHEFRYFRSPKWLQMPGFVLGTSQNMIDKDPKLVEDIVKGSVMGTEFAVTNPDCAVKVHWAAFPDTKPKGMDDAAALKWDRHLLDAQLSMMQETYKAHGSKQWGTAVADEHGVLQDFLLASKQIDKKIDPKTFVINDPTFYDKVNDYDHAALQKLAKDCNLPVK